MKLDANIIIEMHKRIIETSGGTRGVRDIGLLDSAVQSIYQSLMEKTYIQLSWRKQLDYAIH